jgi:allantoinase
MSGPAYDLVVRGHLVLSDRDLPGGWIGVSGETIAAIGAGPPPQARRLHDAGDAFVIPGFVDGQTHATSYAGLPGIESTTMSAVAGGVTTLVDMPYDNPEPLNTLEKLQQKAEAIESLSHADVALYGTVIPGQGVNAMAELARAGVAAFKISSFESNPVRFPRLPADEMLSILEASVETGLPVGLHNEDQEIVRATIASFKALGRMTPEWHSASRPVAAELAATAQFLELGAVTGAHVHIVHFSHPRGYDLVSRYAAEGVNATAELCVHYLHFDADRDIARLGARMKVNPPIRGSVLDGLWRAFHDGKIAFISSDHSSWPVDNKLTASIFDAGAGIPGLETLGPSLYTDLLGRVPSPIRVLVNALCERPARFFGLQHRKGSLSVGCDADIAVLETGDYPFDAANNHDGLRWSPYDGERFKARVAATFVRGQLAWDGSTVCGRPGQGRFIPRPRPATINDESPGRRHANRPA